MPEAINEVVIYNACCLHEGIADCCTHKVKASLFQIFADSIGKGSTGRDIFKVFPSVYYRFTAAESPDVVVKTAEFLLYLEERLCIADSRIYFQTVPDNAGVIH